MAPAPNVTATASMQRVEPGASVDITVTVESNWDAALVAGFLVMTDAGGGAFTSTDEGVGNVGLMDDQPLEYAVGHTAARTLTGGSATFQVTWTAPTTAGAYEFSVFGVTSDDGDGMDDPEIAEESNEPFAKAELAIGVGCDLVTYYYDGDQDGFGNNEVLSCDAPEGYVEQGGDCKDDNPEINPGAVEKCSFADENCDGEAMAPPTFYRDSDADGYGDAADLLVDVCALPEGYAAKSGDCALDDPAVHPEAVEIAGNGVDDNCNGQTDEAGASPTATNTEPAPSAPGVNSSQPGSAPTGSVTPPSQTTDAPQLPPSTKADSSGCRVSNRRGSGAFGWAALLLSAALLRRSLKRRAE